MPNRINILAFIPSRYASTRLPGKPLIEINGKSLLRRVWEGVAQSTLIKEIVVVTDDNRIAEHCFNIGADFVLTPADLPSGTDRGIFAYKTYGYDAEIILNVQGDEPLVTGDDLDSLIINFIKSGADAGTFVTKITDESEIHDSNIVKVIRGYDGNAIYFSRSPIPFVRDMKPELWINSKVHFKHIGIYIFRKDTFLKFGILPASKLENLEKLEQLRLIENGFKIYCHETDSTFIGVDTPEDVKRVKDFLIK